MRNLCLTQSETVATNVKEISSAQLISIDPDANVVYIASESTLSAFDSQTKQVKVCLYITNSIKLEVSASQLNLRNVIG